MDAMFNYYKNSITDNLCDDYKSCWRKAMNDKDELMRLALRQQSLPHIISYAFSGRGLTKDYLLVEFGGSVNGKVYNDVDGVEGFTSAMYAASESEVINVETDVAAFLWCEGIDVEIPKTKCPNIYIGCGSYVNLVCDGFNSIRINLFDKSTVVIDGDGFDENTTVTVYKYSRDSNVVIEGDSSQDHKIKIFEKELRL